MSPVRVVVYPSFGPYHVARLTAAARRVEGLVAIEVSGAQGKYPWREGLELGGFEHRTLLGERTFEEVPVREQIDALIRTLEALAPSSLMVTGYADPVMREATRWARGHGVPCVTAWDSTWVDRERRLLKEAAKAAWCRYYYAGIFASGQRTVDYLRRLRYPTERIWRGTDVVDNAHFAQVEAGELEAFVRGRGLPEHFFLCVSRLAPEKNLDTLLAAHRLYREAGGTFSLVLAGDGPDRASVTRQLDTRDDAQLLGWVGYEELPLLYHASEALVLPSRSEPWGLVVNEACAAGRPVLVSDACGCVPELCHSGENGLVFEPDDAAALARSLRSLEDAGEIARQGMGERSRVLVSALTPETWAETLADCLSTVEGQA